MPPTIAELLQTKRVLLCVGTGGVGKTTLSAALGIAAARRGRRVLVLTVDPARRLANALGLQAFDEQVQHIALPQLGPDQPQVPLDASMLDVKRTFDRVVTRYAHSPQSAQRILAHPFYVQASTALAGSQEYMATERLYECATCGNWDLVVLDTPPTLPLTLREALAAAGELPPPSGPGKKTGRGLGCARKGRDSCHPDRRDLTDWQESPLTSARRG